MVLVKGQVIEAERRKERRAERRRCKCFNGLMVLNAYFAVEHATNAVRTKKNIRRSAFHSSFPLHGLCGFPYTGVKPAHSTVVELNHHWQLN